MCRTIGKLFALKILPSYKVEKELLQTKLMKLELILSMEEMVLGDIRTLILMMVIMFYAKGKFYASEHAVVVYTHDKQENSTWLGETMRMANFNRLSASAAQPGLAVSTLNFQKIPYPPKDTRRRIGLYLDVKLATIDERIIVFEKLKDAYMRLKKSIIHRAVTQGLNPDVEMKESGVDWIGMIPKHWEIRLLKNMMTIHNGRDYKHIEVDDPEEGYPVIGSGGPFAFAKEKMYSGEALLLGRKGTIDKPLYWHGSFWTVDTMFYAKPSNLANCKYMYYLSLNFPFRKIGTQTALPSMTQTALNCLEVSCPPLTEQQTIADYLDEKTAKIDAVVSNLDQQIEKYKLLKRALINEVVTGQRAV